MSQNHPPLKQTDARAETGERSKCVFWLSSLERAYLFSENSRRRDDANSQTCCQSPKRGISFKQGFLWRDLSACTHRQTAPQLQEFFCRKIPYLFERNTERPFIHREPVASKAGSRYKWGIGARRGEFDRRARTRFIL